MNENINIALIGYGRMGLQIEEISQEMNCKITHIFDIDKPLEINKNYNSNYDFDVALDFSQPEAVLNNIEILANLKKNIIIGTTGWLDKYDKISKIIADSGIGVVHSSNFSIGVQLYNRIIELASVLLNSIPEYDIFIHEIHHNRKLDAPSGTALKLADIIINNLKTKKKIQTKILENKNAENLLVTSSRGGDITGTHTVYIDSESDTIELTHRAKNRMAFARGALVAAHWIKNKSGFYSFEDVMSDLFNK